ncbi:LuxR C-terminal-related transcriptional regulator [Mycobacterium sp. TY815]|uniref:LuxR C-terminal-related transcriptional regulator n=1 Tax=Mycobacterium sp. TY815 TaxID=3050581 RepID=UPI002740A956|nr:LuxR C-terminal-related transcriptional regulator [Mycobacterium sp. TY815]MDP7705164.1 LuxR C-terminal-related transcriptional regulator [Mycobacterium sp. TY815]
MNARAMVARLNELDQEVCDKFGVARSAGATTLDEAISMSAATTERLVGSERDAVSASAHRSVIDFLQAQVEARQMRDCDRVDVVRWLTAGVRRMRKAGSLQGLGRQACTELCDVLGFDTALLSFVEDDGFVVEESDHCVGGPTVIARRDCPAERSCIRLCDTVRTNEAEMPGAPGYRELLGSARYLVAPVIAKSRVVALLHVGRRTEEGVSAEDVDLLDAFASAYSLLHERMLNTERVQQQRTTIARAAARLTEEADRIAAAAISFDDEYDTRVESANNAADSALAATLSHREREVFELLVLGASNAEIGEELVITVETVKTHVKRILRKIGAINRSEAIALYMDEVKPRRPRG